MKNFKKAGIFIFSTLFLCAIWQYKFLLYGFSQLRGQLHIIWNAESGEHFLKVPSIPVEWKTKYALIGSIKKFATDSLGLKQTNNYQTVYNQHDKPVLWVLTGCLPFEFKSKTWWFPLIGEVSYKGFFDLAEAQKSLKKLVDEGYDADLNPTSGWSTLGWFKDPILSNMLHKSEGRLAELIIHELTHGTLFIKSNMDFNENLATFIGEQGALKFLSDTYTKNSGNYKAYLEFKSDETIYGNYILLARERLDSLYKSFTIGNQTSFKNTAKRKMILEIMTQIDSLHLFNKERYRFNPKTDSIPNNTFFITNDLYRKDQQQLEIIYQQKFNGNLRLFISWLKEAPPASLKKLGE